MGLARRATAPGAFMAGALSRYGTMHHGDRRNLRRFHCQRAASLFTLRRSMTRGPLDAQGWMP
jgi:hypothetical protein